MDTKIAGGILLIVGTSIAGGMLALPMVSSGSGFMVSSLMLLFCWIVMTFSAFLILEVNLWLSPGNNLITMAKNTLGLPGVLIVITTYVLLLYSLLSAYISAGSGLFVTAGNWVGLHLPSWLASILFVLIFGFIVYKGIKPVDYVNRGLMLIKMGSLFSLILLTIPFVDHQKLTGGNPKLVIGAMTVMITSFGFSNMIPSLRSYFNDDVKKLRIAILIGSFIPLICYILWDLVILGSLPQEGTDGLADIMERGGSATDLAVSLSHFLNHSSITLFASIFIAISVLTAFLCISLALSDFLADGFKLKKKNHWVHALTFLPSLIIVLFYPSIFVKALSYAGVFCVVLLVILPGLMVWIGRYHKNLSKPNAYQVAGGKISLLIFMLISVIVLGLGVYEIL